MKNNVKKNVRDYEDFCNQLFNESDYATLKTFIKDTYVPAFGTKGNCYRCDHAKLNNFIDNNFVFPDAGKKDDTIRRLAKAFQFTEGESDNDKRATVKVNVTRLFQWIGVDFLKVIPHPLKVEGKVGTLNFHYSDPWDGG
jgi:hypothetical protein